MPFEEIPIYQAEIIHSGRAEAYTEIETHVLPIAKRLKALPSEIDLTGRRIGEISRVYIFTDIETMLKFKQKIESKLKRIVNGSILAVQLTKLDKIRSAPIKLTPEEQQMIWNYGFKAPNSLEEYF